MQGIEILSTLQVVAETTFNWNIFWVVFGVCVFFSLIYGLYHLYDCEWMIVPLMLFVGAISGAFFGCIFTSQFPDTVSYETQYKVTISDEVSMSDFYEHYEVVDQDGKIFTVREKPNETRNT